MITGVPWIIIAVGFSLVLFTVDDVSRFLLHRVMHKYEFLWKFHRVHHSATTLTPFTVFRTHPIESILYFFRGAPQGSLVSNRDGTSRCEMAAVMEGM